MGADRLLPFSNATNELYDSNPSASSSQDMSKFPTGPSHPGAGPRQRPHTTLAKKRKMSSVTNQSERRAQKIAQLPDEVQQMYEASDDEDDSSLSPDAESRNDDLVTKAVLATSNSGPQVCHIPTGSSTIYIYQQQRLFMIDLFDPRICLQQPYHIQTKHQSSSTSRALKSQQAYAAGTLKKAPISAFTTRPAP